MSLVVYVFCIDSFCFLFQVFVRLVYFLSFCFGLVWCLSVCLFTWLAVLRLSFFLDCFLFRFSGLFRFRARLRIYDGNGHKGRGLSRDFPRASAVPDSP